MSDFKYRIPGLVDSLLKLEREVDRLKTPPGARPGGKWQLVTPLATVDGTQTRLYFANELDSPVGISQDASGLFTVGAAGRWTITVSLLRDSSFASYAQIARPDGTTIEEDSTDAGAYTTHVTATPRFVVGDQFQITYATFGGVANLVQRNPGDDVPCVTAVCWGR